MANLTLDPEEKKMVQTDFQSWLEIQDRRKELTSENKAIVNNSSTILNCNSKLVGKLFKVLKKRIEGADDELAELSVLLEEIGGV